MEKMKNKIKETFLDKNLYIFSVITILFFGVFCIMQYAPDTYSVFATNLTDIVSHFFSCGRIVTGAALYIVRGLLHIGNYGTYLLSYGFAILCTIISLYKLNKLVNQEIKNNVVSILISTLIIINPFSIELFVYIEKGIMVLSVLLCVLAVEQIKKFFEGNKKSILLALVFMIVANCCYQGTVGLFVAISLLYIIKYSKNIKEFIVNNVVVALTYGIPAILNFILVRFLFTNERVAGEIVLSESIIKMLQGTKRMLVNTYDLLPKYVFIIIIAILLGIIIYQALKKKISSKKKILEILGAFYVIAGTLFATVAPQILQDTSSIWFVARSSYSMAAIIGLLTMYAFMKTKIHAKMRNSIVIILVAFLLLQFVSFMSFAIDHYVGNYMDKTVTLEINRLISEYEEETGIQITEISIYHDKSIQYTYPELKASGDMNIKAYSADWCVPKIIQLYTGRNLITIENDEKLKNEFLQKNWDVFDEEQIVFQDNILHICLY